MLPFVARFVSVSAVLMILQKGILTLGPVGGWPVAAVVMSFAVPFLASADIGAALMRRLGRTQTGLLGLSVTLTVLYLALHDVLAVMSREVPVLVLAAQRGEMGILLMAFLLAALTGFVRAGIAAGELLGRSDTETNGLTVRRTAFAFRQGSLSAGELVFRFVVVCLAVSALHAVLVFTVGMRTPVLAFVAPVTGGALAAGDYAARRAGVQLEGVQAWLVAVVCATFHVAVQFSLVRMGMPFGWMGAFDIADVQVAVAFAPVAIALGAVLARVCLALGARFAAARRLSKPATD